MYVSSVKLAEFGGTGYVGALPVTSALLGREQLLFDAQVTFIIGENGSGKSTLIEAIAVAMGFNAEGGSRNMSFTTVSTESDLHYWLTVVRAKNPRDGYFFRAETHYNIASEYDRLIGGPPGGVSLHAMSHGESVMQLIGHRFHDNGLFILDEPEAGLSPHRQMALLAEMHYLAAQGSQFIIATHSPILLALPDAAIVEITETGIEPVAYDDCELVAAYREFMADPIRTAQYLCEE